ncbi:MAG TPA: hypothetical protein VD902_03890, partial [Symbiobacteriaceae bacterium]|nr:hypothetical protein [Symbiobacteriaceae bacterium]
MKRRVRWGSLLVLVVMVTFGMVAQVRVSLAGSDPEPTIDPNMSTHFDPGPGWPEGWQEPTVPTELTADAKERFDEVRGWSQPGEEPEQLEMRVYQPLPSWTREYPYRWSWAQVLCGKTMYAYYYPDPDAVLIWEELHVGISVGTGPSGDCEFWPVTSIQRNREMSPEEKANLALGERRNESLYKARGDLEDCQPYYHEATPENIYVCFNDGDASERFDVPA